jgi:hypothetical protein
MKKPPPSPMTAAICLLAAALVLGTVSQPGAAVVCLSSDGHVAVESILDPCCSGDAPHDGGGGDRSAWAAGSCGDCVDVELKVLPLGSKGTRLSPPEVLSKGCPVPPLGNDASLNLLAEPSVGMGHRSQLLDPLRTIVLLI